MGAVKNQRRKDKTGTQLVSWPLHGQVYAIRQGMIGLIWVNSPPMYIFQYAFRTRALRRTFVRYTSPGSAILDE